ncbi:NADH-quinone oxidoreductase subunit A [Mucilaginibacter sp. RS28]|uniref:NADH-quinone oxidoreductase subunit A n=1 Tax=Mucilaginibacter straminoryzae TaxID=2932774 RepID=A0A9X2BBJ1_9SPHI|nr:NADH-quinone oxidoreductase subunit A [Mucilaginibacter straminoryzae]MCJ8209912.1 NADH-quinone oxidoreductase subunit A [Mucilaginibacter straminoryzae]
MAPEAQISEFGKILIFLIVGIVMTGAASLANKLLAPNNPNPEKLTTYECGEEPTGNAWIPFNPRFYVIALVFLLFEVEMVFIFPWATVFADGKINQVYPSWSKFTVVEMFIFVGILILGLAYVWRKGDLNWIKPEIVLPKTDAKVPAELYEKLNREQSAYQVRPFSMEPVKQEEIAKPVVEAETAVRKPMFKPSFKKPGNDTGNE